jgi:hypothetical protein
MNSAISTVNSNSSNINTVSGAITNVNNVGGSITNVNTVATNLASVNNFGEVYRIASSAPTSSLNSGDLYFNTSTNVLNVYGASGWQNAGSSVNGTSDRFKYVASGTPTTFTGSDANGNTLSYDAGFIDVYLNGIKMVNGTDVTVTSGSSIVFASALTNGDIVEAVAFGTFAVASLTNTTVTGSLSFPDNIKAKFGTGNDLEIYHSGTQSIISDVGSGNLNIEGDAKIVLRNTGGSENYAQFFKDGAVELYHNNTKKIETTASGVAVAGDVQVDNGASLGFGGSNYKIEGSSSANHRIAFHTDGSERARFDSSGNFFVATTTEASDDVGHALLASGAAYHTADGTYAGLFNRKSSDGEIVQIRRNNTLVGSLDTVGVSSSGRLVVKSTTFDGFLDRAGTTIAKWMSSSFTPGADNTFDLGRSASERWKDIYLSGGAFIGGTGTANKLSDYEEGTWTPSVTFGNGNTGVNSGASSGSYTKVGRLVNASGLLLLGSKGSSTGHARITGLPFTAGSGNSMNGAVIFGYIERISFSEVLLGLVNTDATTVNLYEAVSGNVSPNAITNSDFNNSTAFRFTITYQTN